MAAKADKKAKSERRALHLARRLDAMRPADMSERQWCIKAGVSSSFFSNLRGTPTKRPSEPSVGNLQDILEAIGSSIAKFYGSPTSENAPPSEEALAVILGYAHEVDMADPVQRERLQIAAGIVRVGLEMISEDPDFDRNPGLLAAALKRAVAPLNDHTPKASLGRPDNRQNKARSRANKA